MSDLFDVRTAHRATDPDTSREAAEAVVKFWSRDCVSVLRAHYRCRLHGGLTDFELARFLERPDRAQTSVGKRRLDLQRQGLIEDSGERRPAPSGRRAIVWRITGLGVQRWLTMGGKW